MKDSAATGQPSLQKDELLQLIVENVRDYAIAENLLIPPSRKCCNLFILQPSPTACFSSIKLDSITT